MNCINSQPAKLVNVLLAFSLVSLLAFTSLFAAPAPRALADSATSVSIGAGTASVGGAVTTELVVNGYSGANGVGAYNIWILFDQTKLQVSSVQGSGVTDDPYFGGTPTNNRILANGNGELRMNAIHAEPIGPGAPGAQTGFTGSTVKLARVTWQPVTGGVHGLTVQIVTLADTSGAPVTGVAAANGSVTATTVKSGTGTVNKDSTVDIPITVMGVPAPGLGSYKVNVAFDKTKINVQSVLDGAAPWGAPTVKTIDNNAGTVVLEDAAAGAAGDTVVASLRVLGMAGGSTTLAVTITELKNTSAANVTATAENGTVTVTSLAVETQSVALNVGAAVDANVTIKSFPAPGLKSYNVTIGFDNTKVTVNSVATGGDAVFGAPTTATIDNGAGTVVLADAAPGTTFPTGDVVVAKLNLQGVAAGTTTLTITINSLVDGADASRAAGTLKTEGVATVTGVVVKTASGAVNIGSGANINLSVEGLVGQALGEYNVRVAFDNTKINILTVNAGSAPFTNPVANINNNGGTVDISQTVAGSTATGNINVGVIRIVGMSGASGTSPLTLTVNSLKNSSNANITFTTSNGTVTVLATKIEVGSALLARGASVDVPITVREAPPLVAGKGGIGAFQMRIDFDPAKLQVNTITRGAGLGALGDFTNSASDPAAKAAMNSSGQAVLNWFHAQAAGPTGDVVIATMNVSAAGAGVNALTINTSYPAIDASLILTDPAGTAIGHTKTNGAITVFSVEAGTALSTVGETAQIPITVRAPAGANGLGSYAATVSFDKTKLRVDSVADGVAPFGRPETWTFDNDAGTVTLVDSQTGATPNPTGDIVVAILNVTTLATSVTSLSDTTATPVTLNVTALTDTAGTTAGGLPIAGAAGSVQIVPVPTVTIASTAVSTQGVTSVPITVAVHNSLVPLGVGAYNFRVDFDKTKITLVGASGGPAPFDSNPTVGPSPIDNFMTLNSFHSVSPGPRGSFVIANLRATGLVAGQTTLTLAITTLAKVEGPAIAATPVDGVITVQTSPDVTTSAATAIGPVSATLNGALVSMGTATSVQVFFIYGLPGNLTNETARTTLTAPGTFSAIVTNLSQTTGYGFQARAEGHGSGSGTVLTFTTLRAGGGGGGGGAVAPPPAPVTTQPPAPKPVTGSVSGSVTVNQGATATDAQGFLAPPTPGQSITVGMVGDTLTLTLPVSTGRDTTLATFNDPASGVKIEKNQLSIPVKDAAGNVVLTVVVTTGPAQGHGSSAQAEVKKIEVRTAPTSGGVTVSANQPTPSTTVTGQVRFETKGVPAGSVTSRVLSGTDARGAMPDVMKQFGARIKDVGFGLQVTTSDITSSGPGTVTLTGPKSWVDARGGTANLGVARQGSAELVKPKSVKVVGDTVTVEAVVSEVTANSVFALVALQPEPVVTPTPAATTPPAPAPTAAPKPTITAAPKPSPTARPRPKPTVTAPPPTRPPAAKPTPRPPTPAPVVTTPPPPPPPPPVPPVEAPPAGPNVGLIIGIVAALIAALLVVWLLFFRVRKID